VILKRFYPGLGLIGGVFFVASAACLVGLLFMGDLVGTVIFAGLCRRPRQLGLGVRRQECVV
jgi:hypothetical protein